MLKITESEKENLFNLVDTLVANGFKKALTCNHTTYTVDTDSLYIWKESHRSFLRNNHLSIESGATRIVVISDNKWVLKFSPLESDMTQDYNCLEAGYYQRACEENLEYLFAATYCLGARCGLMIYAQERVKVDEDCTSDSFLNYTLENYFDRCSHEDYSEEEIQEAAWEESCELDNDDRIYAMIENVHDADKLIYFINKYDINDLHCGNWGYRGDQPVLIDYSGY